MSLFTWRILTRRSEKWTWKFRWRKLFKNDFAFVYLCFPCLPDFYYYYIYNICKTRQWDSLVNQQETIKQSKKPLLPFIKHFNFPFSLAWTDRKALHLWMWLISQEWGAVPVNGVQDWGGPGECDEAGGDICFRRQMSGQCLTEKQTKKNAKDSIKFKKSEVRCSSVMDTQGFFSCLFFEAVS